MRDLYSELFECLQFYDSVRTTIGNLADIFYDEREESKSLFTNEMLEIANCLERILELTKLAMTRKLTNKGIECRLQTDGDEDS